MNRKIIIIILVITLLPITLFSNPDEFNNYFIRAAKKAKPSVVTIIVYKNTGKGIKRNLWKAAHGTGTLIFKRGYIVTNNHLIKKGNIYRVADFNGVPLPLHRFTNGKLYLSDPKTDIALLKVRNDNRIRLKPISMADSNAISEGEWVIAIGNPYGLQQSITGGIISSKGRDNIGFTDIEDFIQTDAAINPGNSGGPLVNLYGKMIGLNTAISTVSGGSQGISFAIPVNIVRRVCYDLIRYGRVRRGWLGFIIKERTVNSIKGRTSVEIISVVKNSPAQLAGLRRGDIIKELDGKKVNTNGMIVKHIANKPIGSKVYLSVSRNGFFKDFSLMLREKHVHQKIFSGLQDFFYSYGTELDENADNNNVIVSYISPKSFQYGLKKGDQIISVNKRRIRSIDDFVKVYFQSNKNIDTMRIFRDKRMFIINLD